MDAAVAFGHALRKFRKAKNMTQEQLALEAGIERNFVSLIELGRNQPSITTIFKLANALNVKASEMIAEMEF